MVQMSWSAFDKMIISQSIEAGIIPYWLSPEKKKELKAKIKKEKKK
jgi:hypothetical protein